MQPQYQYFRLNYIKKHPTFDLLKKNKISLSYS